MQIYSETKLEQYTLIESEGKQYKVLSCIDNEFFDNGIGYTLTVEYVGEMLQ